MYNHKFTENAIFLGVAYYRYRVTYHAETLTKATIMQLGTEPTWLGVSLKDKAPNTTLPRKTYSNSTGGNRKNRFEVDYVAKTSGYRRARLIFFIETKVISEADAPHHKNCINVLEKRFLQIRYNFFFQKTTKSVKFGLDKRGNVSN